MNGRIENLRITRGVALYPRPRRFSRALLLIAVLVATTLAAILWAVAHAGEPPRYSAQETLRRAQVGTSSPRLAAPVRVKIAGRPAPARPGAFDRLRCYPNPAEPGTIICEPWRNP